MMWGRGSDQLHFVIIQKYNQDVLSGQRHIHLETCLKYTDSLSSDNTVDNWTADFVWQFLEPRLWWFGHNFLFLHHEEIMLH